MAKLPYMQFYCDDWLSDEKLRACSSAAIGLWIDMLCLMHKNDRRGYLQLNDKPVSPAQLARMTGRAADEVSLQLAELLDAGVPSVSEHGIVYSRRMIRDERIREVRADAGSKGGKVTQGICLSKTSSKVQASAQANLEQNPGSGSGSGIEPLEKRKRGPGRKENQGFEQFWAAYPRRQKRPPALKAWERISPDAVLLKQILEAVERDKKSEQWRDPKYIPLPASWLNAAQWEDEPLPPPAPPDPKTIPNWQRAAINKTPEQIQADTLAERERQKAEAEAKRKTIPAGFSILEQRKLLNGLGEMPKENP